MKTAVSIPDKTFRNAEQIAKELGIPRSRLFARALEEFIQKHNRRRILKRLNEIYAGAEPSEDRLLQAGLRGLRKATEHDAW